MLECNVKRDGISVYLMKVQIPKPSTRYTSLHRFVVHSHTNLQPIRIPRRPFFLHLSFVTASLLTAAVFYPVFMSEAKIEMDSHRSSQATLVRFLKHSLRISSPQVERALLAVDRRHFVDPSLPLYMVYQDMPLPIGFEETISAPHMHATCLELLQVQATGPTRILDVGSGSGYLTAALAVLAGEDAFVLGIEKHKELAERSLLNIQRSNPELLSGDQPRVKILAGNVLSEVLDEMDPFDVIHVGAAAPSIPRNLVDKLNSGGRMVIPVGPRTHIQELILVEKDAEGKVSMESLMQVRYVPLTTPRTGEAV